MLVNDGLLSGHELRPRVEITAREVLRVCAARANEAIIVLVDEDTAPLLIEAFTGGIRALGAEADPVVLSMRPRQPAFADLPPAAVDALLVADLVIDLTTEPWLYSDSLTRYAQQCRDAGSRLALVWGTAESLATIAACPPSPLLTARARRGLEALNSARSIHVRSSYGTDFSATLGDPAEYPRGFIGEPPVAPGVIGAPLCASVTAPFVPGTARGTLAFVGAGRFQGPRNLPLRSQQPVMITIEDGRVRHVAGEGAAAVALRDWFASATHDDVNIIMDCNIGFDPRADLAWADNTVVHSYAGSIMIGIARPYEYRPQGSHRPGYHLDLMFPSVDVDIDDTPFIRGGHFVPESAIG
jgi:hypothetical protein